MVPQSNSGSSQFKRVNLFCMFFSGESWFKQVWKYSSTPNSCETLLLIWFPQSNRGLSRFNRIEAPCALWNYPVNMVPLVKLWFYQVWCGCTTPNPCNFSMLPLWNWFMQVRRDWIEPSGKYSVCLVLSIELWFKQAGKDWITPNSCETILLTRFPESNCGSSRFDEVKPPWTDFHMSSGWFNTFKPAWTTTHCRLKFRVHSVWCPTLGTLLNPGKLWEWCIHESIL